MVLPPIIKQAAGLAYDALQAAETGEELQEAIYAMWMSVDSSAISEVRWQDSIMFVRFTNGYEYAYPGVPVSVFEEFLNAPSKGKFLNAVIKPNYS